MALKKLKLDEKTLNVESFDAAAVPEARGTVNGHFTGVYKPICITGCLYCYVPSSDTLIQSDPG